MAQVETCSGSGSRFWWGEAPEWLYDWARGAGGFLPNDVNTPKNVPSRGSALDHGSAGFRRIGTVPPRPISGSGSIMGPPGSLAPPMDEQERSPADPLQMGLSAIPNTKY